MGAKRRGSTTLSIAAMGRRAPALGITQDDHDTTLENGVFWYRYCNTFGFADSSNVWLNDCDVLEPHSGKRVSWFVDRGVGLCPLPSFLQQMHLRPYNVHLRLEKHSFARACDASSFSLHMSFPSFSATTYVPVRVLPLHTNECTDRRVALVSSSQSPHHHLIPPVRPLPLVCFSLLGHCPAAAVGCFNVKLRD